MSKLDEPPGARPEASGSNRRPEYESCLTLPASIQWAEPGAGAGELHHLQTGSDAPELTIYEHSTPPSALLKIRMTVEPRARGPRVKQPLFLLISPDVIGNVTLTDNSGGGSTPQVSVGNGASGPAPSSHCLLFELSSRADLIGPPKSMLPAHRTLRAGLDSIGLFAKQLVFRIFVNINNAQERCLTRLCQALSKYELGPIDPSNQIAGFYRGQGSQRLDPDVGLYDYYNAASSASRTGQDLDALPSSSRAGEDLEALPAYNEVGPPPPPPPFSDASSNHSGSLKRKRAPSNTEPSASNTVDQTAVEALCRKIMAEEHTRNQEKLRAEISRMKEQICGQYLPKELSKMKARIVDRLEKKIDKAVRRIRQELLDQHELLETQVDDLDRRVEDRIWHEVDERVTDEKVSLEDWVKEEVDNTVGDAEDRVKESIKKATFFIQFED